MPYKERLMYFNVVLFFLLLTQCSASDITPTVFGSNLNVIPAAFGDFNSDDLTDMFVITGKTRVEVFLNSNEGEPLLQDSKIGCEMGCEVLSVVPGDFNGDALMDVMVATRCPEDHNNSVIILWGNINSINCSTKAILRTKDQPLAVDFNNDFITDLFGEDEHGSRKFWVFNVNKTHDTIGYKNHCGHHPVGGNKKKGLNMTIPHSNAYLDLNNDNLDDIFVTSFHGDTHFFEFWYGTSTPITEDKFSCDIILMFNATATLPGSTVKKMGQSLFLDVELKGKLDLILPVLSSTGSKLFVYSTLNSPSTEDKEWQDTRIDLTDPSGVTWQWGYDEKIPLLQGITIRGCDFNMDGYPDLIAPLVSPSGATQTVLLENVPCTNCASFSRKFNVIWNAFYPNANDTVTGAFFDIFQDGVMDVILIYKKGDVFSVGAFKNNLDYDANFVKVMVLSGLQNSQFSHVDTPLGRKKRTFGSNLPGPRIWYKTFDQEGNVRVGMSSQIPQSAHFALSLPYTMFALGRTPNFVDTLTVGFADQQREWQQLIPNSQMVVIPYPVDTPSGWKVKLFVTPSKAVLVSGASLLGLCIVIVSIIGFLEYRERRSDRIDRTQSFPFYFDAM